MSTYIFAYIFVGGHFLRHGTISQIPVHKLFDQPATKSTLARFILFLDPHVEHLKKLKATPAKPGVRLNFAKKVGGLGVLKLTVAAPKDMLTRSTHP